MKEENRSKKYTDYHYVSASEYGNAIKVCNFNKLTDHVHFNAKSTAEKCFENNALFGPVASLGFPLAEVRW